MKLILAVSLCLLAAAPTRAADDEAKEVRATLEPTVKSVLGALADKKMAKPERKAKIMSLVDDVFDLQLMGKLTLGRAHWGEFSEAQQKEFSDTFIRTIKDSYYDKMELFTNETVEFDDPKPGEKGKYEMLTYVLSKEHHYKINYKLYHTKAGWKVYDVEIEGVSLVKTYGGQYDQFLQGGKPEALLAKMKEKSFDTPEDLKNAGEKPKPAQK